jgi:glycerol uptake facilitator-like aquaporin
MYKNYIAEGIGTFALSFAVVAAGAVATSLPLAVPVIAALTLTLFVFTIGPISGSHINPAVTFGLWSVGKIETKDAVGYVIAQLIGAFAAFMIADAWLGISGTNMQTSMDTNIFFAEALGAFFFTFGIAAVVLGKLSAQVSGFVVGGSLLLGIIIASVSGALGILNPAVAVALGATSLTYLVAPIVGSVAGFWTYRILIQ